MKGRGGGGGWGERANGRERKREKMVRRDGKHEWSFLHWGQLISDKRLEWRHMNSHLGETSNRKTGH